MTVFTLLMAVGLAMDAFGMSVALGSNYKNKFLQRGLISSSIFGGFHTIMPILGWMIGENFKEVISGADHWIAFGLLLTIGLRMIYMDVKRKSGIPAGKIIDLKLIIILALVTSMDALILGMGIAFLGLPVLATAWIVGGVTFGLSLGGVSLGAKYYRHFRHRTGIFGGIILILIGIKTLADHLI